MDISYPKPRKIVVANDAPTQLKPLGRYRMPPGECTYCDVHRAEQMMPPHTASRGCKSGSRNHCTCDACF